MLNVSKSQIAVVGNEMFISRAIQFLSENDESFGSLDKMDKRKFITLSTDIAIGYGFGVEQAIMTYILVSWTLGPDFASRYPDLDIVLRDTTKGDLDRSHNLYLQVLTILDPEE